MSTKEDRKSKNLISPKTQKTPERFSITGTENAFLKDVYTVNLKKLSLILIYIITELYAIFNRMKFRLIAPIAPAPFDLNHVI